MAKDFKDKAEMLEILRNLSVSTVDIEYCGSGDEGGIENVTVHDTKQDTEVDAGKTKLRQVEIEESFLNSKTGNWERRKKMKDQSLSDYLEDIADDILDHVGVSGYGNNEGGGGTITIDVKSGDIAIYHYNNEIIQNHESHQA